MAKNTLSDQRRNENERPRELKRALTPSDLLLAPGLSEKEVVRLLKPYGFREDKCVDANLQGMAGDPQSRRVLASFIGDLLQAVSETADPDQALNHWEQFLRDGVNRVQLFEYLRNSPRMLQLLCSLFGNVPNLAQTLIRDPVLIYWLAEEKVLSRRPSKQSLSEALSLILGNLTTMEVKLDALRRFKRREMLRIGVRDLLRVASVEETIAVLSDLAAVLLEAAFQIVTDRLQGQYGRPIHFRPGRGDVETGFAVMAMGKLGGGELNFSSDVDLIYVYETDDGRMVSLDRSFAQTKDSREGIAPEEYFEILARDFTNALADITQEGYVFRVDLRLRAEGSVGKLARSITEYTQYYRTRGQVWERMALVKAYPVAGSVRIGKSFLKAVRPFIIGSTRDIESQKELEHVPSQVKAIKSMIDEHMRQRNQEERNVKLGFGGIREIEFAVQTIQILYGGQIPGIVDRNTLSTLEKLKAEKILSLNEVQKLRKGYLFLRDIEHKLQMVHDIQTHALPVNQEELAQSAVRLGYHKTVKGGGLKKFLSEYRETTTFVHRMFLKLVDESRENSILKNATKRGKRSKKM